MRKFLIAAAVVTGVGFCTGAFAADNASYSPKTTAYLNFGFGGSANNTSLLSSMHYGLRMDQSTAATVGQPVRPAFLQADFNLRDGFSGAMVNGVRFASRVKQFDEDGGDTSYSMVDWGLLAIGAVGLGVGIAEVLKTTDDKDPTPAAGGPTTPGSGGSNPLCSVPVVGGIVCPTLTETQVDTGMSNYDRLNWLDSGMGQMGDLVTVR